MSNKLKEHRTKDIGQRVAHIADREAVKACQECQGAGNCSLFPAWQEVFETVLKEFSWPVTVTEN